MPHPWSSPHPAFALTPPLRSPNLGWENQGHRGRADPKVTPGLEVQTAPCLPPGPWGSAMEGAASAGGGRCTIQRRGPGRTAPMEVPHLRGPQQTATACTSHSRLRCGPSIPKSPTGQLRGSVRSGRQTARGGEERRDKGNAAGGRTCPRNAHGPPWGTDADPAAPTRPVVPAARTRCSPVPHKVCDCPGPSAPCTGPPTASSPVHTPAAGGQRQRIVHTPDAPLRQRAPQTRP